MRLILLPVSLVLGLVTPAFGQPVFQFEVGPVVRLDKVSIEGTGGSTIVAGLNTTFMISKNYGVEAELTRAWRRFERDYEGWFISYAQGPAASREEIERLAPRARRTLGYEPGIGGAIAFVARGQISPRMSLASRAGISARHYVETSTFTILSIPEGVDPADVAKDFRDSSGEMTYPGLFFGLEASLVLTRHLSLTPEVRFAPGRLTFLDELHSVLGLGVRGAWRF